MNIFMTLSPLILSGWKTSGGAAERAIEVEVVEPGVEAVLVEHVAALEHADLLPIP